ncbi:YicC/YloC family endoribonuclease [methanotrophic endosymbiont of Bathymodiolus puteoserpentis (Logatchev)]|uniref:YicC/YloC family endoribonuclease n=1 Tax=methanotrophic endosymbiont of Bathymodiolus puteoserpentis (Logatchev) TaxID=343235 RepID=UPI0013CDB663|nr:YicC/YloC family endoribonuclease [methanotrophic endosymbiont of Bathymodiolus puteoserpentis (Logatchev)]SHE19246.1 Protein YicC [methanotrophic endosymbiont of Bathymodiolus puteoserpentis (Logatchev)]
MTNSMTAFANSEVEFENLTLNCELRSVNHRYCDISLKIPERFRFAEADIRSAISDKLKRGKIECSLSYKKHNLMQHTVSVDMQAVKALLATTKSIEQLMGTSRSFSALEVLAFPGIQVEKEGDKVALQQALQQLLQIAIDNLLAARQREGAQLSHLIRTRCIKLQKFVGQAHARMPIVLELLRTKFKSHIAELVAESNERIEQEMVLLTQKLDVDEELDRLDTHIIEVLRVLEQDGPVGRRLDFLMQEMNREANTLGSKSADKEMTAFSIEMKVLIEQMREQVQNIE